MLKSSYLTLCHLKPIQGQSKDNFISRLTDTIAIAIEGIEVEDLNIFQLNSDYSICELTAVIYSKLVTQGQDEFSEEAASLFKSAYNQLRSILSRSGITDYAIDLQLKPI